MLFRSPYVGRNAEILSLLQAGRPAEAAAALEVYLGESERTVLAAFARLG